ncbi:hypothetical protein SDC9_11328 [bioreactor metagenome]|uniref:Uncharacterized protein n=1 Tax=bioreactor metagenome TaxID=1076179 RepID=A0A644TFQ1_9ZZZZ|nr:DUF523 domain-containing protein [Negativicutes bacterium]
MILISACLLGLNTKYDGKSNAHEIIMRYSSHGRFIPVCPEQLGGLPTPRPPAEIIAGTGDDVLQSKAKVIADNGHDLTQQFKAGTEQLLKILDSFPITAAIFKERSPSCGVYQIYDGTFSHITRFGQGVATAVLRKAGVMMIADDEVTEEKILQLLAADNFT